MSQITTGLRAILSHPKVYNFFQDLVGARDIRSKFAQEFVRAQPGARVLDIGCGTASILEFLPPVEYVGFDVSDHYIAEAQARFGDRGQFHCRELTPELLAPLPKFDLVLAIGLLHHLDDGYARNFFHLVQPALRPGGRLVTLDPCLDPGQNPIAAYLVRHDRGQNVRNKTGYESLVPDIFAEVKGLVRHRSWLPYTHCVMEIVSQRPAS